VTIKVISGLPEKVEKAEKSCDSCPTTYVIIKVFPVNSKTPLEKAEIKLTILSDKSTAKGVTDKNGFITFEILDLKSSSDKVQIDTTDANRPPIKINVFDITKGKDNNLCVELGSHIKAIYIVDGKILLKDKKAYLQWVNLPLDDKWVKLINSATNSSLVTSKDRLSRDITLQVEFYHPSSDDFKITMIPGKDNATYSKGEIGRNDNYKTLPEDLKTAVSRKLTDSAIKEIKGNFRVTAAGGDNYTFEASDNYGNTVKCAASILTKRILFIQPLIMDDKNVTFPKNPSPFLTEYSTYHIELIQLKAGVVDYFPNLNSETETAFLKSAETVFKQSKAINFSPFSIALALVDHSAPSPFIPEIQTTSIFESDSQKEVQVLTKTLWENIDKTDWFVEASYKPEPRSKDVKSNQDKIESNEKKIELLEDQEEIKKLEEENEKLEKENEKLQEEFDELLVADSMQDEIYETEDDIVNVEDDIDLLEKEIEEESEDEEIKILEEKKKILEGKINTLKDDLKKLKLKKDIRDDTTLIPIPKNLCVPQPHISDDLPTNMTFHKNVKIDLSKALKEKRAGFLELQYNNISYFRGGYSMRGRNLCTIVTRSKWKLKNDIEKIICMMHEVGHQFGMVPNLKTDDKPGKFNEDLDRHKYQYIGKGHSGSHCAYDIGDKESYEYSKLSSPEASKIQCVMYGDARGAPAKFCKACAEALIKKDLSFGFDDFWKPYDPSEIWT
jgi:hypothetical protein